MGPSAQTAALAEKLQTSGAGVNDLKRVVLRP